MRIRKNAVIFISIMIMIVYGTMFVNAAMGHAPISGTTSQGSYYGGVTIDYGYAEVSLVAEPYDNGEEMYLEITGSAYDEKKGVYVSLACGGGNYCYRRETGTKFTYAQVTFKVEGVIKGTRTAYAE